MNRRHFLQIASIALASAAVAAETPPLWQKVPRRRGFNLLDKFIFPQNGRFPETDIAWIKELGFDAVRLPMDYRCWTEPGDWTQFREDVLKEIDEAVALGEKHGVHVCINFHRAPGHTVAQPPEEKSIWADDEALRVCALHWGMFAKRYQGISSDRLSFNLFNEPTKVSAKRHQAVVAAVLAAIRESDPQRLVLCDGRLWGRIPPKELLGLNVAASTHAYDPFPLTHYQASWAGKWEGVPTPTYPLEERGMRWNKEYLRKRTIDPWKELEKQGMGITVGEFGAFNKTPHDVVLAWMRDCLELWRDADWGWALWNFRGPFGVLDSQRADVSYDDWNGHKLDSGMLEVLQNG